MSECISPVGDKLKLRHLLLPALAACGHPLPGLDPEPAFASSGGATMESPAQTSEQLPPHSDIAGLGKFVVAE